MTSITSEEVNYLVWRYLQESGFVHSAYTFSQESFIGRAGSAPTTTGAIPPGMLISMLQKGLHYLAIEVHLEEDGRERVCGRPFNLLETHVCERPSTTLAVAVKAEDHEEEETSFNVTSNTALSIASLPTRAELNKRNGNRSYLMAGDEQLMAEKGEEEEIEHDLMSSNSGGKVDGRKKKRKKEHVEGNEITEGSSQKRKERKKKSSNGTTGAASGKLNNIEQEVVRVKTEADTENNTNNNTTFHENVTLFSKVNKLEGHLSEVTTCGWNPKKEIHLLASASGDGTVKLWTIPGEGTWDREEAMLTVRTLDHHLTTTTVAEEVEGNTLTSTSTPTDITTMVWSPDGMILATGTSGGIIRLWNLEGDLLVMFNAHKGPIFQMQWSPNGAHLVSVGSNPPIVLWEYSTRQIHSSFDHHTAPALDIDWRDDTSFASCSSDGKILIYQITRTTNSPILTLEGHQNEVNSIKWSPDGTCLLSSSDDGTARIWKLSTSVKEQVEREEEGEVKEDLLLLKECLVLEGHEKEIYTAKWGGPLPSTDPNINTSNSFIVATASFDGSIRLWNSANGNLLARLLGEKGALAVYAIAFSPGGRYLISGGLDGRLFLWSISSDNTMGGEFMVPESPIRRYKTGGSVFEVVWSPSRTRLAACSSDATLTILDI